jgi:hypothetical protein
VLRDAASALALARRRLAAVLVCMGAVGVAGVMAGAPRSLKNEAKSENRSRQSLPDCSAPSSQQRNTLSHLHVWVRQWRQHVAARRRSRVVTGESHAEVEHATCIGRVWRPDERRVPVTKHVGRDTHNMHKRQQQCAYHSNRSLSNGAAEASASGVICSSMRSRCSVRMAVRVAAADVDGTNGTETDESVRRSGVVVGVLADDGDDVAGALIASASALADVGGSTALADDESASAVRMPSTRSSGRDEIRRCTPVTSNTRQPHRCQHNWNSTLTHTRVRRLVVSQTHHEQRGRILDHRQQHVVVDVPTTTYTHDDTAHTRAHAPVNEIQCLHAPPASAQRRAHACGIEMLCVRAACAREHTQPYARTHARTHAHLHLSQRYALQHRTADRERLDVGDASAVGHVERAQRV